FDHGLNLLTGETGSGKSIIVDALGVLIGGRVTSDLLKSGSERAFIEWLFSVVAGRELQTLFDAAGIEITSSRNPGTTVDGSNEPHEIIIRRELSASGRNKIFINNQLATQSLLRDLRPFLVDIHGQGDQQTLFNADTHLEMLDAFAGHDALRAEVAEAYEALSSLQQELARLRKDS